MPAITLEIVICGSLRAHRSRRGRQQADKSSVHLSAVRVLLGLSEDYALQQVRTALFGKQPVTQTARIVSKYKNSLKYGRNNHVHYRQAKRGWDSPPYGVINVAAPMSKQPI
jgi:hypothetical protein